jgi:hypothetical protein
MAFLETGFGKSFALGYQECTTKIQSHEKACNLCNNSGSRDFCLSAGNQVSKGIKKRKRQFEN